MAVTLIGIDGRYMIADRKFYMISSQDEISTLPTKNKDGTGINGRCAPGSLAYTPDLVYVAILGSDDQWHEVQWGVGP